jgi:hypothetical protein
MVTKAELMASGMSPALANKLGQDVINIGLTATGSVQGDALQITSSSSIFATVAAGTGAILPSAHGKADYMIMNNGANALAVYPSLGERFNGGSANASFSLPAGKNVIFKANNNQWFANASA